MVGRAAHQLSPGSARFCPLCGGGLDVQPVPPDGKPEKVCDRCGFVFYLDHKVVAGSITEHEGRLLLVRRAIQPALGKWTFPGGYVDWGESVAAAAVRETQEETGVEVALGGLVGVYSYPRSPVIVVYRGRFAGGSLRPCHENDRVEWVRPGAIPWDDLAFPSTRDALQDFLRS
jgi:ADP-ribose pyrophosphatase YjhB (NUDIX family)